MSCYGFFLALLCQVILALVGFRVANNTLNYQTRDEGAEQVSICRREGIGTCRNVTGPARHAKFPAPTKPRLLRAFALASAPATVATVSTRDRAALASNRRQYPGAARSILLGDGLRRSEALHTKPGQLDLLLGCLGSKNSAGRG